MTITAKGLIDDILNGEEKSAARLISLIEGGNKEAYEALSHLLPSTLKAHVVGITGPAGAGKSTLTGSLAVSLTERFGNKVGIIATDPTSIKGSGAFLGDRLRMKGAEEKEIFIRSMANRGYPGGVAKAAMGAVYVMEGLGKDVIILESAGAGQSEKELFYICDTVITVFAPDYGDDIQLMKAGLAEIGDIIVVNKADMPGAENASLALSACTPVMTGPNAWKIPVILTQGQRGEGVDVLAEAIEAHRLNLDNNEKRKQIKKEKTETFLLAILKEELWLRFKEKISGNNVYTQAMNDLEARKINIYSAVELILNDSVK